MERMKILLVEPMNVPRLIEINHDLDTMQKLVGGTIACTYPWEDLVGLVHADDGIALGYPPNRMLRDENGEVYDIVPGTFFICGLTSNDFGSISDELAAKFSELFRYPEMYVRAENNEVFCFRLGSDEPPIRIV